MQELPDGDAKSATNYVPKWSTRSRHPRRDDRSGIGDRGEQRHVVMHSPQPGPASMRLTITARTSDRASAWAVVLRHVSLWITLFALVALGWRAAGSAVPDSSEPTASAWSPSAQADAGRWRTAGRTVGRLCRAMLPTELDALPCAVPSLIGKGEAR